MKSARCKQAAASAAVSLGAVGIAAAQPCQPLWKVTHDPPARTGHAMVYDAVRETFLMFGGEVNATPYFDGTTWVGDGVTWTRVANSGPSPRSVHSMVVNPANGHALLYGGSTPDVRMDDLWEWDGARWTRRSQGMPGPGPRIDTALAFDASRSTLVLFGGFGNSGRAPAQTWEWSGSSWRLASSSGPSPRDRHAMCWDAARRRVVLFGGTTDSGLSRETWEWDGLAWRLAATTGPTARSRHTLAFDPTTQRTLLFRGRDAGAKSDEVWAWDGAVWMLVAEGGLPLDLELGAVAYDPLRQVALEVTEMPESGIPDPRECWRWSQAAGWERIARSEQPNGRNGQHLMAFDAARGEAILCDYLATYSWAGDVWIARSTFAPSVFDSAMIYDSRRQRIVFFGGGRTLNAIHEWDGASWAQIEPAGPRPSTRYYHALAFDSRRGVAVLFGGYNGAEYLGDTWEWNGTAWSHRPVPGPSPRGGAGMAFDEGRGVTVLLGGGPGSGRDTWEWDGAAWRQITNHAPYVPGAHSLYYDSMRQRVVAVVPGENRPQEAQTWEWNGTQWSVRVSGGLPYREDPAVAFDSIRGVSVLFGGAATDPHTYELGSPGPAVTAQPSPLAVFPGEAARFTAAAVGTGTLRFQWRKDGIPLDDDGRVTGAQTPTLSIDPAVPTDTGLYDALITDDCGSEPTRTAALSVHCRADCDTSTGPNVLDIFDYLCFQTAYYRAQPYACNCDTSTGPALCDIFDFLCFQNAFDAGCP